MIQKNIKNLVTLVLCVLLFTGTLSFPISCGETNIGASETNTSDSLPCVTYKYSFEQPEITQRTIGDRCYSRVALSGTSPYGQTGEPVLPVKEARILLPYQTTVDSIEIIPGTTTEIRLPFKIEPTGVPVPLSQSQYAHEPLPDQKIYSSSSSFPSQRFIDAGIQHFRGFSIINIVLYPVQYIPADDIITCVSDITVIVHLKEITTEPVLYRGFSIDFNDVSTFIDNSEILRTYPLRNLSSGSLTQYDLLIITTNYLKNGFLPLARFHALQGIKTRIVSLNQIPHSPQYSMRVTPEEIRDFIRDEYLNYGIQYVLLGGDDNVVPVQQLYFGEVEIWGMPIPVSGPSDFFYACLDGTYNYNGNDRWGEPHDGENGTDVDLISDIYVGRACVGTLNEVKNFTEKTLKYNQISINDDYFANTVMAGEYLWGPPEYPEEIYGDEYMEELIGGSSNNNYVTVGFPNDEYSLFNITRLYDRYHPWSAYQLKILINQGLNIINHLGHGNEEQALKMMKQEAYDLSNEKPCFIYSQACLAGAFDSEWSYDDCFTEYLHIKTNHGAFALIMNTRYGLGDGYGTDGPSQRFHRWFWDGVFDKEITEISAANHYSKTVNVPLIHTDQYLRFCCYEITYFGDPTVAFKFPKPDHDVDLVQTDLRPQVKSEDHIQVNVTLRNNGLYEEHNITLELLVDGHVSSQLFIPVLQKEQQKNVILDWVTPVAGEYTVMINVTVPEIVEHDYRNNRITQIVQVGVLNRDTQELFNCIQAAIDDDGTMAGHWILIPRGVYYENVVINKDILLKGEQKECTILEPLHSSDTVITFTQCQSA